MGKVNSILLIPNKEDEITIKDSGSIMQWQDLVFINMQMGLNMKDIGRIINPMDLGERFFSISQFMKETMLMALNKIKVNSPFLMVLFTKVRFQMI